MFIFFGGVGGGSGISLQVGSFEKILDATDVLNNYIDLAHVPTTSGIIKGEWTDSTNAGVSIDQDTHYHINSSLPRRIVFDILLTVGDTVRFSYLY